MVRHHFQRQNPEGKPLPRIELWQIAKRLVNLVPKRIKLNPCRFRTVTLQNAKQRVTLFHSKRKMINGPPFIVPAILSMVARMVNRVSPAILRVFQPLFCFFGFVQLHNICFKNSAAKGNN